MFKSDMVYVHRSKTKVVAEYASILGQTEREVSIIGVTLVSFIWNPSFRDSTADAVNRGVKFRVLLANPKSPFFEFLSNDYTDRLKEELKISLRGWKELQNELFSKKQIEIRFYNDPSKFTFLMITDDRVFVAPYMESSSTAISPCFEVSRSNKPIFQTLKDHFEIIWSRSSEIGKGE